MYKFEVWSRTGTRRIIEFEEMRDVVVTGEYFFKNPGIPDSEELFFSVQDCWAEQDLALSSSRTRTFFWLEVKSSDYWMIHISDVKNMVQELGELNNVCMVYHKKHEKIWSIYLLVSIGSSNSKEECNDKIDYMVDYLHQRSRLKFYRQCIGRDGCPPFAHDPNAIINNRVALFPLAATYNKALDKYIISSDIHLAENYRPVKLLMRYVEAMKESQVQIITDKKSMYFIGFTIAALKSAGALYFCHFWRSSEFCRDYSFEEVYSYCMSNTDCKSINRIFPYLEKLGIRPSGETTNCQLPELPTTKNDHENIASN